MMKKRQGFTTIELMVVIGIIAIVAATAIPAFTVWMPNYRIRAATNDLYANMQLAKSGAVRDRNTWAVRFDTTNNSYQILSDDNGDPDSEDNDWWNGDEVVEKTVVLSDYRSGVAFGPGNATDDVPGNGSAPTDDVTYGGDVAVFNMRGTCNAGYVYLENSKNKTFAVGSLSSGAVRMRRWSGSTWE
jgi:prepilin-type N-terminal cleavage/methylation domain-containing protein